MDRSSIAQGTLPCHPFHTELPVVYTPEGHFIPIRAICQMLGLLPRTWIGVICREFTYGTDDGDLRRLPWTMNDGAERMDWCLKQESFGLWLTRLNPKHAQGERREQLMAFDRHMMKAASARFDQMQDDYAGVKRRLYADLQKCDTSQRAIAETQAWFHTHLSHMHDLAEAESMLVELDAIIARGIALYDALADALRAALKDVLDTPVIDGVVVQDGEVVDTVSMPFLPVTPDLAEVDACRRRLDEWTKQELFPWLASHGGAA